MQHVRARSYSWNRFNTPNLSIVAPLAAASHEFMFEDFRVRVELPPEARAGDGDEARMIVTSRRTADKSPLTFGVRDVDVQIDQPDTTDILAFIDSPNREDVDTEFITPMGKFAVRAFDNWLRVLRWRSLNWSIGRLGRDQRASWGTYLREKGTHRLLAAGVHYFFASSDRPFTIELWSDIQATLERGRTSPLFYDLYFDGQEHLAEEDFRRAVVDFANACEVLLKTLLDRRVPDDLYGPARDYILRAQASVLLHRFGPTLLGEAAAAVFRGCRHDVEQLFAARNDALHSHQPGALTAERCQQFRAATAVLLKAGSEVLEGLSAQ
jgi:hypothetical protein